MGFTSHPKVHHRPRYGNLMYVNVPDSQAIMAGQYIVSHIICVCSSLSLEVSDDDGPVT